MTATTAKSEQQDTIGLRRKMIAALLLHLCDDALTEIGWRPSQAEYTSIVDKDCVAIQRTLARIGTDFEVFVERVRVNMPDLTEDDDDLVDVVTRARRVFAAALKVMHRQARRPIRSAPTEAEAAAAAESSDRKD